MEKDNEYYFKYFPNNYELIINFINIYSNKYLEKIFYIFDVQELYFNYNIKSDIHSNGLFFDVEGNIHIKGYYSNETEYKEYIKKNNIQSYNKYFILDHNKKYNYLNLFVNISSSTSTLFKIYDINVVTIINKLNSQYEIKKGKNYIFILEKYLQNNFSVFASFTIISLRNKNNIMKLILSSEEIITSKNFLFTKLSEISGIFIKASEDDIFEIKLIPEEISKYIKEGTMTVYDNSIIEQKAYYCIEFINSQEKTLIYYNNITDNLKIYELNVGNNFNLDDFINNNNNLSKFTGIKTIEEQKTFIILKEASNQFLYEKYINYFTDFNYILDESKICYLFMDFEYNFSCSKKIKNLLLKILNFNISTEVEIKCGNELMKIEKEINLINIEKCNGEFIIKGNNTLIHFYLPYIINDEYILIEDNDKDSFTLSNIKQLFIVPKKNDYNSINILITLDYIPNIYPVYFYYYIDYGIIPYSNIKEKKFIIITNKTNIIIPNFSKYSKENEKFFIFFYFNTTISNLNIKMTYENILNLDSKDHIIFKSGKHILKFINKNDYYLNLTKSDNNKDDAIVSVCKNEDCINYSNKSDPKNLIQIKEASYNENLLIKIENSQNILLCVSPNYFYNLSDIIHDDSIYVEQNENILIVKFNTTSYNAKLEYYIALIDKNDDITPISYHDFIFNNNYIYRNIFNSKGIEPIETNISLKINFKYNKNYTLIVLGKEMYDDSFNYIYYEPKKIFINKDNKDSDDSHTDETDETKKGDSKKLSLGIIILIVVSSILFLGGIIFVTICCVKRKNKSKNEYTKITKMVDLVEFKI